MPKRKYQNGESCAVGGCQEVHSPSQNKRLVNGMCKRHYLRNFRYGRTDLFFKSNGDAFLETLYPNGAVYLAPARRQGRGWTEKKGRLAVA